MKTKLKKPLTLLFILCFSLELATLKSIIDHCVSYLEENTPLVYEPIISYLEEHGSLDHFHYETRPFGFGINYEWLVRCGITKRHGTPETVPFLKQAEKLSYHLS